MADEIPSYRQVALGEVVPNAVTVTIEAGASGALRATVSWVRIDAHDAGAVRYDDVSVALGAAENLKTEKGLAEVVVALDEAALWDGTGLSDEEGFRLAADIESENDA